MTLPVLFLHPLDRTYKRDDRGRFGSGGSGESVRDALAGATTLAELNTAANGEAARITGRAGIGTGVTFNMQHSDVEVAKEHAEGIMRGLEEFPNAPLSRVTDFDPDVPSIMHYGDLADAIAYSSMGYEKGSINFNARFSGHPDKYERTLNLSANMGVTATPGVHAPHLAAPTMQGIALHEFGHILSSRQRGPQGGEPPRAPKIPARDIATEMKGEHKTTSGFIREQISEYATTNSHELSAEAFSDVMAHGDMASPVSRAIYNELKTVYSTKAISWLAPLGRTYKRDDEGQFSSDGGGSEGDEEDLGAPVEPELLGTASGGGRSVATFTDPDGMYGEPGGHVVSISDRGEKPNWSNSDGMDNGELTVSTGDAQAIARGLDAMAGVGHSASDPKIDPEEGPVVLGTMVVGEYRATAFHDGNGDFGGEGERFIQVSEASTANWRDSLRGASEGRLLDVDLADAPGLVAALRTAAGATAVTWLRPLDRTYKRDKRGRFGSGDGGGEEAPAEEPKTGIDALPKMKKLPTATAAAKGTNPNYETYDDAAAPTYRQEGKAGQKWTPEMGPPPSGAYSMNCTNCGQAFEMRMRGYDVEAAPLDVLDKHGYAAGRTYKETDEQIASSWTLPNGKPHGRSFSGQKWKSFEEADTEIKAWPEGGRGYATVGKHVFNVMKKAGKAVYVDSQFNASPTRVVTAQYRKKYRSMKSSLDGTRQEVKIVRLDDLEPAHGILEAVTAKAVS